MTIAQSTVEFGGAEHSLESTIDHTTGGKEFTNSQSSWSVNLLASEEELSGGDLSYEGSYLSSYTATTSGATLGGVTTAYDHFINRAILTPRAARPNPRWVFASPIVLRASR